MDSISYNKADHTYTCRFHSIRSNAVVEAELTIDQYDEELAKWYSLSPEVHEHNRKNGVKCFNDWLLVRLSFSI